MTDKAYKRVNLWRRLRHHPFEERIKNKNNVLRTVCISEYYAGQVPSFQSKKFCHQPRYMSSEQKE